MARWYFVPKDWEISEDLLKWTRNKGLSDNQIEEVLESYRDHQYKRPMMDPNACWRNWVKNAIKWGDVVPTTVKVYNKPQELTDEQKQADLRKWEEDMRKLRVVK